MENLFLSIDHDGQIGIWDRHPELDHGYWVNPDDEDSLLMAHPGPDDGAAYEPVCLAVG